MLKLPHTSVVYNLNKKDIKDRRWVSRHYIYIYIYIYIYSHGCEYHCNDIKVHVYLVLCSIPCLDLFV